MLFRPFRAYYFSFYSMELHSMLVICALSGLIIIFHFTAWSFTSLHLGYFAPSGLIIIFHFTAWSFTPCWLFMPFQGLLLFFILPHGASLHAGYLCSFSIYYCSIKNTLRHLI